MGKRLVRDRALENWVVPGAEHQVRDVTGPLEHIELLMLKGLEEWGEVMMAGDRDDLIKELSDVITVCESLALVNGISLDELSAKVTERIQQGGSFVQGKVWETSR